MDSMLEVFCLFVFFNYVVLNQRGLAQTTALNPIKDIFEFILSLLAHTKKWIPILRIDFGL